MNKFVILNVSVCLPVCLSIYLSIHPIKICVVHPKKNEKVLKWNHTYTIPRSVLYMMFLKNATAIITALTHFRHRLRFQTFSQFTFRLQTHTHTHNKPPVASWRRTRPFFFLEFWQVFASNEPTCGSKTENYGAARGRWVARRFRPREDVDQAYHRKQPAACHLDLSVGTT